MESTTICGSVSMAWAVSVAAGDVNLQVPEMVFVFLCTSSTLFLALLPASSAISVSWLLLGGVILVKMC